jgi:beta-glucosidase
MLHPVCRFSFSWNRILPQGGKGTPVNPEGIAFYNSLINEMIANNIRPYATIFHWDLPQVRAATCFGW